MAKRRQSAKQRAASLRNLKKARSARKGHRGRKRSYNIKVRRPMVRSKGHRAHRSRNRVIVTARRNSPGKSMLNGWVNLPTVKEGAGIVVAAVALPFLTKQVSNLVPVATLQGDGYGNILLEFGIGAVASGVAHKMHQPVLAEAILVLSTAKAGYRVTKKLLPSLGLSEELISGDESVGAYVDRAPGMGAYVDRAPGMGDEIGAGGLPAVTIGEDVAF